MAKKKTKEPAAEPPLCPSAPTETVHRSQIKEVAWNPRDMNDEERRLLAQSLKKFGLVTLLCWNKRSGNLVGGHQRLVELDKRMGSKDYRLTVNVVDLE